MTERYAPRSRSLSGLDREASSPVLEAAGSTDSEPYGGLLRSISGATDPFHRSSPTAKANASKEHSQCGDLVRTRSANKCARLDGAPSGLLTVLTASTRNGECEQNPASPHASSETWGNSGPAMGRTQSVPARRFVERPPLSKEPPGISGGECGGGRDQQENNAVSFNYGEWGDATDLNDRIFYEVTVECREELECLRVGADGVIHDVRARTVRGNGGGSSDESQVQEPGVNAHVRRMQDQGVDVFHRIVHLALPEQCGRQSPCCASWTEAVDDVAESGCFPVKVTVEIP